MAALVTLAQAKEHLRIELADTDHDADITAKADEASLIITQYLQAQADATWTDVTVPSDVKAAVKIMLAHLYEHRGDDMKDADAAVWEAIGRLLMRRRDPVLA